MWGKKTLTTRCNCNTRVWRFIAQDILWVHVQIGHHGTPVLVNMRVCLVKRGGPVLLLPLVVLSPSQAGVKCNLTASTLLQGPESVGIATIFIFYWFWRNADSHWTQLSQYASMHMHTRTHHRYPYKERSLDNVSLPRGIPPPPSNKQVAEFPCCRGGQKNRWCWYHYAAASTTNNRPRHTNQQHFAKDTLSREDPLLTSLHNVSVGPCLCRWHRNHTNQPVHCTGMVVHRHLSNGERLIRKPPRLPFLLTRPVVDAAHLWLPNMVVYRVTTPTHVQHMCLKECHGGGSWWKWTLPLGNCLHSREEKTRRITRLPQWGNLEGEI